MTDGNAISIEKLWKSYKTRGGDDDGFSDALKGISLDIPKGSFFGLLGPNGAGKSTLINIIAGLTIKTSGAIRIMDYDIDTDRRQAKQCIGVVPQEVVLDPFFSVWETLEFYAGYFGVPKNKRRTKEIIEALKLTDKKDVNSRKLSGGMKRRVLIAKALVHNPPILILDEPTAGVDVELREQLWEYVEGLNKQGVTILLTTHYLEEAERLCDRIAIINNGEIISSERTSVMMKMLDDKRITIEFASELKDIPGELVKYGAKLEGDGSISIGYKSGQVSVGEIIADAQSTGLQIRDLTTMEPKLEDIFKHLTKKAS